MPARLPAREFEVDGTCLSEAGYRHLQAMLAKLKGEKKRRRMRKSSDAVAASAFKVDTIAAICHQVANGHDDNAG